MANYKSNNATMGEICAQLIKHEQNNKPISSNKDLMIKMNEAESRQQHYAKPAKSGQYNDEGEGFV
jgi:hypothetical protein